MSSVEQAVETQLANIQKKTGKSLAELTDLLKASGLAKHGELRDWVMQALGLGHGDANALVHAVLNSDGTRQAQEKNHAELLDEIYAGAKSGLRPIHEALMKEITRLGAFEIAPKKGYFSLRRRKQFAMLGPATQTRFELGLNAKDLPPSERLLEQPKGSMCNYIVRLSEATQVDAEVLNWVKAAFESAG